MVVLVLVLVLLRVFVELLGLLLVTFQLWSVRGRFKDHF